jgi:hypothetical protein
VRRAPSQFERPARLIEPPRAVDAPRSDASRRCGSLHGLPQAVIALAAILAAIIPIGCLPQKFAGPTSKLANRLRPKPIPPGPNGLYMDVIHLERPFGDPELNHDLWAKADEEQLAIALRENLTTQGFRVAVLGGSLPEILKTLFNEEEVGQMNGEHLVLQQAIATQVHTGGIHPAWPKGANETAKDVSPTAPLPETDPSMPDRLANYINATGCLRVTPRITSGGCVDLVVLPEIQHGDARKLFVPNLGLNGPLDWSIQVGRQSRLFEDLTFILRLRPCQYALIGCHPNDRESVAARFFSRSKDGQLMQRIVLIRAEASSEAIAARSIQP